MKLIDVTNSYAELVTKQLESTDAHFIRVYTLGKTTVIYTESATHKEIAIINKQRNIKTFEIDEVIHKLIGKQVKKENLDIIYLDNLVEISVPIETNVSA